MKKTSLDKSIDAVLEIKFAAIDRLVEDFIEPLSVIDNPEKLISKPYEQWTTQDLQLLKTIYGEGENTPLSNLIFKRTYERVKKLEIEEH